MKHPVFLVAGHVTRDLSDAGWSIGGTVAYASLAAREVGQAVRVVTAHAGDLEGSNPFRGSECFKLPSEFTTTFRNENRGDERVQTLISKGAPLTTHGLDETWRKPEILHLAPVFREIGLEFASWFKPALSCATLQGWMRTIRPPDRRVTFGLSEDWLELLHMLDIAIYSDHDIKHNMKERSRIHRSVPLCVETRGSRGCQVIEAGREYVVASEIVVDADTTGAGDIFATAFFHAYYRTGNCIAAAETANRFVADLLMSPCFREPLALGHEPALD